MRHLVRISYRLLLMALLVVLMVMGIYYLLRDGIRRQEAEVAMQEYLDIPPGSLSNLKYEHYWPGFTGDDGYYFEFQYPNDKWIEDFMVRHSAKPVSEPEADPPMKFWRSSGIEIYELENTGYPRGFLEINRKSLSACIEIYSL